MNPSTTSNRSDGGLYGRILARLYNVQPVDKETYRSAQIFGGHVRRLINHYGLRALMNLRGTNPETWWYSNENRVCGNMGVELISVSLSSRKLPPRSLVLEILDALEQAPRPLLIKCSGGADRTSFVSGLYAMQKTFEITGASNMDAVVATALHQTRRLPYLHFPKKKQRWIRAFFEFYRDDHQGLSPRTWVERRYNRDRFADHLRGRGLAGCWKEVR